MRLREVTVTGGYGSFLREVPGYLDSTVSRDSRDSWVGYGYGRLRLRAGGYERLREVTGGYRRLREVTVTWNIFIDVT